MTPSRAEDHMRAARVQAEGRKQSAYDAAMKLQGAAHVAALRQAEREYCLDLARAAEATGGLVDARYYHQSAWWHEVITR